MHSFIRLWAILFIVVLAGIPALAEEIQLKDGTKVTGKITGVKDDVFQVKTSYGEIQIPRSEIVSINFPENQPKSAATEKEIAEPPVQESLEGTHYVNRTGNFELYLPPGWKIARKQPGLLAFLSSSDETVVLTIKSEVFGGTLNSYKELVEMQLKNNFSNYKRLGESTVALDGKAGVQLEWKGKAKDDSDNTPMRNLDVLLPYEGKVMRITFLTVEVLFNDARPQMEKILASYKSLKP